MAYIVEFIVNQSSRDSIYEQIINQIKLSITKGELSAGDILPSVRALAKSLSVSTLSVQRAYAELQKEGIIESAEGKGSFVSANINTSSLKDALIQTLEGEAARIIAMAKENGIGLPELLELLQLLWEEN